MSFILDALKKSESDRQRQSGPALFEVKVAPPKPQFPYWALALAALLVINIAIGAWVFLRRPPPEPVSAPQPEAMQLPAARQIAPPQAVAAAPAPLPAPSAAVTAPPAPSASAATASNPASPPEPVLSGAESKAAQVNPDDYEPAVEPAKQTQRMDGVHVRSGTESGFKSYADAQSNPDSHLPLLRIDLHVYAANPQERFVLINMRRLHEGDALPEGGHIDSITPEGAVVSYQGSKYFLEHE
jgi:general secretion pathway protein B